MFVVRRKVKGMRKKVLIELNNFSICSINIGKLICKEELIAYYQNSKWILVSKSLKSQFFSMFVNVMLFNFEVKIKCFICSRLNF
jgi:hypothetical protein